MVCSREHPLSNSETPSSPISLDSLQGTSRQFILQSGLRSPTLALLALATCSLFRETIFPHQPSVPCLRLTMMYGVVCSS